MIVKTLRLIFLTLFFVTLLSLIFKAENVSDLLTIVLFYLSIPLGLLMDQLLSVLIEGRFDWSSEMAMKIDFIVATLIYSIGGYYQWYWIYSIGKKIMRESESGHP